MIPRIPSQSTDWKSALRQAVTQPEVLLELVELPRSLWLEKATQASQAFPLKVPMAYIRRIEKGNPQDPLLLQVLPLKQELDATAGYTSDPVGEIGSVCTPGLLHKYHGRALMITTGACAVHCRYCFRRHFPYPELHTGGHHLQPALDYLRSHEEIEEVILSGGDPLVLDNDVISRLLSQLKEIPQVQRIRIHSRLPVVLPERVNEAFLRVLEPYSDMLVMVIHGNHVQELDSTVAEAINSLNQAGIRIFNQTVLLKNINDSISALCCLSKALFDLHVQPYYLNILDRVAGASHFEVPQAEAVALHDGMKSQLPGYLIPRLVREVSGESSKVWI